MNNNEDIISLGIIISVILGFFLKSVSSKAIKESGKSWLQYGIPMKGFAILTMLLVAGLIVTWFNVDEKDKMPVLMMIAMSSLLGIPLVLESFFVRIGFDDHELICKSGWRKTRVISWDDLKSAKFSHSMQWWEIKTGKAGKIRLHVYLSGLQELLIELGKHEIEIT
jgi:hypothetical protein